MENENKQPLVQVKDLCKYFQINRHATLKAVDHVSFDIHKGVKNLSVNDCVICYCIT